MKSIASDRLHNLDLLKFIALLLVIFIHNFYLNDNILLNKTGITTFNYCIRIIVNLGVPIFFSVNGYLLFSKDFHLDKHLKKTIKIFILLVFWMVIVTTSLIPVYTDTTKNFIIILLGVKSGSKWLGYLWFLYSLILLYIFFPILKVVFDNNKKIFNQFFIIVFFSTVGIKLIEMVFQLIELFIIQKELLKLILGFINKINITYGASWGVHLLFFMTGAMLYQFKDKVNTTKCKIIALSLSFISIIIFMVYAYLMSSIQNELYKGNFVYNSIFMEILLISIFILSFSCNNNSKNNMMNKIIKIITKNSLGIYLIHWIISKYIRFLFINIYQINIFDNLFSNIVLVIIILMISYALTLIIKKIPVLKRLVEI